MILYLPAGLIFCYLVWRLILPLPWGKGAKGIAIAGLFAASQEYLISHLWGGPASPEIPAGLLMLQGWLFSSCVLLFLLVLCRDIFRLGRRLWPSRHTKTPPSADFSPDRRRLLGMLSVWPVCDVLAGATLLPTAYGVAQGVAVPPVRPLDCALPHLAPEWENLRILQVSDMHVSALLRRNWVENIVERINAAQADLIVFTGDMIDGLPRQRREALEPLQQLHARYGIFGCLGNHEYYHGVSAWLPTFEKLGIHMLCNSHIVLHGTSQHLVLAGLTDLIARRFSLPQPNLHAALAGSPENALRILLVHRPARAAAYATSGIDLQLSGHTHGGQIPLLRSIVARRNGGYLSGWYQRKGMRLYVSSGAGLWSGFPLRLDTPSELPLIRLQRAAS